MDIKARVTKVNYTNIPSLRALATITLDDCFVVKDIKIIEGKNGLFMSMPNKKVGEDYKDICFPIKSETRQQIIDTIMNEYNSTEDSISNETDLPF